MERAGDTHIVWDSILHIIIFLFVFSMMFWFVTSYTNGAAFWEDFYAKEIARFLNTATPGTEVKMDVSRLAAVAAKSGKSLNQVISIDNVNNLVTVSARKSAGTSFGFFNDIDVVDYRVQGPSGSPEASQFIFIVKERQR